MADTTIAAQLIELIDAKDDITAAINESAVGTTHTGSLSNKLFTQYGDVIRAIFAVQDITENCTSLGSLFTPGKLTCYYVDLSKLGDSITDKPIKDTNLWLFSMALTRDNNGVEELDNVAQLAINRTVSIDLSKIFVRYSETVDRQNKIVSKWSDWFEYTTKNYVDNQIESIDVTEQVNQLKTVVSVINPSTPKVGDIKVDGSNIYIYDGNNNWQLMNAWQ